MCHSGLTSHCSGHGLGVSPDTEKVNADSREDAPRRRTPGFRAELGQRAKGAGGRRPGAGASRGRGMPLHSQYGENGGSDSATQERGWAVPGGLGDLDFGRAGLAAAKAAGTRPAQPPAWGWGGGPGPRLQVRSAPEDFSGLVGRGTTRNSGSVSTPKWGGSDRDKTRCLAPTRV